MNLEYVTLEKIFKCLLFIDRYNKCFFTPQPLRGCWSIVFTHWCPDGRAGGKVCLPAILEISFSYEKHIWTAATDYALLYNCAISINSYSPINKFYSFIFFSLLINAVILLLNCLVLKLYLYIHFLSLRYYFLY